MRTPTRTPFAALAALLLPVALLGQESDDSWVGTWQGDLNVGPQVLPLVVHISHGADGLAATMDSPAQGATGIPVSGVEVDGAGLVLVVAAVQGRYEGTLQDDGTVDGTWSQGPNSFPLVLERAPDGVAETVVPRPEDRPQAPRAPFPYMSEDVRFPNPGDGFELAGTLTVPDGDGPFPGVVLVSGSGPQDRDETLAGHKPFAVLADHLSRAGVAVLRYDDRGVGESGGDFASATSQDFATDADAALAWLGDRPEVRADAVGIVGHSEGGLVGPLVASTSERPRFLVLLAGPGVPGKDVLRTQSRAISELAGVPEEIIEMNDRVLTTVFEILDETPDGDDVAARVRSVLEGEVMAVDPADRAAGGIPDELGPWLDAQVAQLSGPWMRFFLEYDPAPALEATRVPVLAVNGTLDSQVDAEINLAAIDAALSRGGNPDYTVEELPGLNHLFQEAPTGSPTEYAVIDQTMSPAAMDRVAGWILEQARR